MEVPVMHEHMKRKHVGVTDEGETSARRAKTVYPSLYEDVKMVV